MTGNDDELMTVKEMAEKYRASRWYVYDEIKKGELIAVKYGRDYRVWASEAARWAAAKMTRTPGGDKGGSGAAA